MSKQTQLQFKRIPNKHLAADPDAIPAAQKRDRIGLFKVVNLNVHYKKGSTPEGSRLVDIRVPGGSGRVYSVHLYTKNLREGQVISITRTQFERRVQPVAIPADLAKLKITRRGVYTEKTTPAPKGIIPRKSTGCPPMSEKNRRCVICGGPHWECRYAKGCNFPNEDLLGMRARVNAFLARY